MQKTLPVVLRKKDSNKVSLEITKDNFESFCNAVGLFRADFLKVLRKSEADHKAGRVTKRKSLYELIEKP
jgi:hypothetical protein